eukprot:1068159-Amphidinium_carterae.1
MRFGYYTDTQTRVWLPLPGINQSVYRAEFLAVVRALEECQPHEVVSDCKEGSKRSRLSKPDGELRKDRTLAAPLPGQRIRWMKAHLKQKDVDSGSSTADDLHGNGQANVLANQGTPAHGPLEPDAHWLSRLDFANKVYHLWRPVVPKLKEPDDETRVRL